MPFSGTMYSEVSAGAYQIDDMLKDFNNRISALRGDANRLVSEMTAFGTEWGPIVAAASNLAAAEPGNISRQHLSSHVLSLVADYNTIMDKVQNLAAAIDSALNVSQ